MQPFSIANKPLGSQSVVQFPSPSAIAYRQKHGDLGTVSENDKLMDSLLSLEVLHLIGRVFWLRAAMFESCKMPNDHKV